MKDHAEEAGKLFSQGYNCAQSVFAAFCDETGMDFETALRLSGPFGGGMGRMREVCGALSGIFMAAGLKFGFSDPKDGDAKAEHYLLIRSLAEDFKSRHDSILCRELLDLAPGADDQPPAAQAGKHPHDDRCARFVADAARILDELIEEKSASAMIGGGSDTEREPSGR